jgi:hypothetical protein
MRIESSAFSSSSLQSIVIPRNVQFIDGSAFCNVELSSITIENGNTTFVGENHLLIHLDCPKCPSGDSSASLEVETGSRSVLRAILWTLSSLLFFVTFIAIDIFIFRFHRSKRARIPTVHDDPCDSELANNTIHDRHVTSSSTATMERIQAEPVFFSHPTHPILSRSLDRRSDELFLPDKIYSGAFAIFFR